jgi:GntR family transcriptional repressor for pyruvate dehydrogenase complex
MLPPVPPPERPHETVARHIRSAILEGVYAPGDRLPVERELSEQFQVSRSAVRQALLILDQQGLVRVKPGQGGGPFVARERLPAAVTAFENLIKADEASVGEFLRAKILFEPPVAALAAETISTVDLQRLQDNVMRTREAADRGEDVVSLSLEFHSILYRSVRNRFLEAVFEILNRSCSQFPAAMLELVDQHNVVDDHAQMLDALGRGAGAEARDLMEAHLLKVWREELRPASP